MVDGYPSLIRIIVKGGIGERGYGENGAYCPQCHLAFEIDPPGADLLRCPFCHGSLRRKPWRNRQSGVIAQAPRIDPAKYGVTVDGE